MTVVVRFFCLWCLKTTDGKIKKIDGDNAVRAECLICKHEAEVCLNLYGIESLPRGCA